MIYGWNLFFTSKLGVVFFSKCQRGEIKQQQMVVFTWKNEEVAPGYPKKWWLLVVTCCRPIALNDAVNLPDPAKISMQNIWCSRRREDPSHNLISAVTHHNLPLTKPESLAFVSPGEYQSNIILHAWYSGRWNAHCSFQLNQRPDFATPPFNRKDWSLDGIASQTSRSEAPTMLKSKAILCLLQIGPTETITTGGLEVLSDEALRQIWSSAASILAFLAFSFPFWLMRRKTSQTYHSFNQRWWLSLGLHTFPKRIGNTPKITDYINKPKTIIFTNSS